jgi:hypothetical protein
MITILILCGLAHLKRVSVIVGRLNLFNTTSLTVSHPRLPLLTLASNPFNVQLRHCQCPLILRWASKMYSPVRRGSSASMGSTGGTSNPGSGTTVSTIASISTTTYRPPPSAAIPERKMDNIDPGDVAGSSERERTTLRSNDFVDPWVQPPHIQFNIRLLVYDPTPTFSASIYSLELDRSPPDLTLSNSTHTLPIPFNSSTGFASITSPFSFCGSVSFANQDNAVFEIALTDFDIHLHQLLSSLSSATPPPAKPSYSLTLSNHPRLSQRSLTKPHSRFLAYHDTC